MNDNNWGGVRKGAGRPAKGKNTKCITMTFTIEQAMKLQALAQAEHITVSQYVIRHCDLAKNTDLKEKPLVKNSYNIDSAFNKQVADSSSDKDYSVDR